MDTATIRARNFAALFAKFKEQNSGVPRHGSLKAFAEKLGLSDRYLSHIKTGRKNIGAATARQIEKALKLPHGWTDVPHQGAEGGETTAEKRLLETVATLFREDPVATQAAVIEMLQRRGQNKKA